jgi:hypothetical protein
LKRMRIEKVQNEINVRKKAIMNLRNFAKAQE